MSLFVVYVLRRPTLKRRAVKSTVQCHTSAVTQQNNNNRNGEGPWGGSTEKRKRRTEQAQISCFGR